MTNTKQKGKLIVIESSGDRLGKTTLMNKMVDYLKAEGHKLAYIHFPNEQNQTGRSIISLLDPKSPLDIRTIPPDIIANLYFIDMAYSTNKIKELLDKGTYVLLDRYYYSAMLYETVLASLKDLNLDIIKYANMLCKLAKETYYLLDPDLVIGLYAKKPVKELYQSVQEAPDNLEGTEIQNKVRQVFLRLIEEQDDFKSFLLFNRYDENDRLIEADEILEQIKKYL